MLSRASRQPSATPNHPSEPFDPNFVSVEQLFVSDASFQQLFNN